MSSHRFRSLLGLVAIAVGLLPSSAAAQVDLRTTYRISGASFLRAFQEVVEQPREWTVRIQRQHPRTERWTDAALGVVVREDGLVITKASELTGNLRVKLADREAGNREAKILQTNATHDLALLQLDLSDDDGRSFGPLPVVKWATGREAEVGRWVVTPTTYRSPAAVGIVSVPVRAIPRTELPGMLGVTFQSGSRNALFGEAEIGDLVVDGPADRVGLIEGDVITAVNGRNTPTARRTIGAIAQHRPGDTIRLTVRHADDEVEDVSVMLAQPNTQLLEARNMRFDMMNGLGGDLSERRSNFPAAVQHDSVLEPSDCGGPALNIDGEAMGLNIARAGRTETLMIPASIVQPVITTMLRSVERQAARPFSR